MSDLAWLDEINEEVEALPPDWRPDVQRLCRAVRELAEALERLVAADDGMELVDEAVAYFGGRRQEDMRAVAASARANARAVLERWRRGGE